MGAQELDTRMSGWNFMAEHTNEERQVEVSGDEDGMAIAEDEWAEGMRKLLEGLEGERAQVQGSKVTQGGQGMFGLEGMGTGTGNGMGFEWALNDIGVEVAI